MAAAVATTAQSATANGLVVNSDVTDRALGGADKAAVLLLALGPDHGRAIFEELDEIEIRRLSRAMANLGPISQSMLDGLLTEFVTDISSNGNIAGNSETTERLLLSFLPADRVDMIMEEIRGPAGRNIWEKLSNVQEDVLASYLRNEYPQTIAVVLSKLNTDHASRLLAVFPEELALDVVGRMLNLDPVQKEVLDKIEATLRTEFMSNLAHTQRRDSHEQMADIFNSFDRQTETRFLSALEETNRDAADRIKELMFTFDDLLNLEPTAIQAVLGAMDKNDLVIALKGASDDAKNLFFSNMSARAAKIARDDMENTGPVRLSDVDEAQGRMVNIAKDLAARGEIIITKGDSEQMVI